MTNQSLAPAPAAESALSSTNIIDQLIEKVRNAKLAPNVDANMPTSWIEHSHYKPSDYKDGEGLVNIELAHSSPDTVQYIRAYLVHPSPTQPRKDMLRDEQRIGRMILDVATEGVDDALLVRFDQDKNLIVTSGHTRRFCAVNAGLMLLPCKFDVENQGSVTHTLIKEMKTNLFRQDINPADKAAHYLKILDSAQRETGQDVSTEQAIELLHTQLDCTREDAVKYLRISQLDSRVRDLLSNKLLTFERAAMIAEGISDPHIQFRAASDFIAREGSNEEIITRYRLNGGSAAAPTSSAQSTGTKQQDDVAEYKVGDVRIRMKSASGLDTQRQIKVLKAILKRLEGEQ